MLSVYPQSDGDAAKAYFFKGLVHGDYYTEGQERIGQWWGKGAELLGLHGAVGTKEFCRLADNEHPFTNERLTLRNDLDRRAAYDLTFSPSKSVSIAALLLGDERLIAAVGQSVVASLQEAEQLIQTRVRKGGLVSDRFTNNMVVAMFPHLTARPEAGELPDPQLHVHAYTVNATFDTAEHVWKAIEAFQVKFNAPYLEAFFHNDLARRVQELGYRVTAKGQFWEIKGVPQEAIRLFSKRTSRVNAVAQERGIEDPKEKAGLAAKTRRGKAPQHSMEELRKEWWSQLPGPLAKKLTSVRPDAKAYEPLSPDARRVEAMKLVKSVSASVFERSSTITERRFLEQCLRKSLGRLDVGDLRAAIESTDLEVRDYKGLRRLTHPEVVREEQEIVAAVKNGKGLFRPLQNEPNPPLDLTRDQGMAFRHVASSRDRFLVVDGAPGTGKTRLTVAAEQAMTGPIRKLLSPLVGDKVVFLAPTTIASRVVLREEGFKDADTIAKFMTDPMLQNKAKGGWVWVDEASQIGTKDGHALLKMLTDLNCRAVFSGDRKQTKAVARGSLMDLMIDHAGCQSPRMEEIVRQKGRLKEIVSTFNQGNVKQGLAALSNDGDLEVHPSGICEQKAAEEYVKRIQAKEKVALVTPTHAGAKHVTTRVREELKSAGKIKSERTMRTWVDAGLTDEGKQDVANYKLGQMVQINKRIPGFEFGKQYEVINVSPFKMYPYSQQVIVRAPGQIAEALPMKHADRWSVYNPAEIEIGKGDVIRMTRNTMTHTVLGQFRARVIDQFNLPEKKASFKKTELANGTEHRVIGFALNGDAVLEGQKILPKDFGHITHGYCRTVQSSQAITTDSAIFVGTKDQLTAVDGRSFLVSVTRARSTLKVFTDDADALQQAASKWSNEIGAYELVKNGSDPSMVDSRSEQERAEAERYMEWVKAQEKDEPEHEH